jgi:hypothetical protein
MDWQKYSMREPFSQTHKVSVSGKNESTTYFISGNFTDNNGIVKQTGVKVGNLRMNLDKTLHPLLTIGTRSSFSYTANTMTQGVEANGGLNNSMMKQIVLFRPFLSATSDDPDNEDDVVEGPIAWLSPLQKALFSKNHSRLDIFGICVNNI